jgi:poly(A) polymerase
MSTGLRAAREALAGREAWLVGGAVRDELLGRPSADFDIVVADDPKLAAKAVARAAGRAACFALSEEFGSWRVVDRGGEWQVDVEPLRGEDLTADLGLRDFTVNAIAQPIEGGAPIDPLGGERDLRSGSLRMAGPASFELDPLRVLRMVRIAIELGLAPEDHTSACAQAQAARLSEVSGERVFMELRRIIAAREARQGLEMLGQLGAGAVVLPELEALRGVEQNRFHHLDVYGHTLEVLDRAIELSAPRASGGDEAADALGDLGEPVGVLLDEPLADEMTRGEALRWGALLHDAAKPLTHDIRPDGRVTFIGHDRRGAELARDVLERLRASERLRAHVAGLVRHHLDLGFLVHEPQPLSRRTVYRYLKSCSPVEVDVTLLSIADRLATRGDGATEAIAKHLQLAQAMLGEALSWRAQGTLTPLLRGDELARKLGIVAGSRLGELLEAIAEARFAGEVSTPEQALEHARGLQRGAWHPSAGDRASG